jgi:RNA methyltransferase, TrmH family
VRDRRARRDEDLLVVDGPRALATFSAAGGVIEAVFVDDPERVPDGVDAKAVWAVDRAELDRISDAATPQGMLAIGRSRVVPLERAAEHRLIVVLDGVQDPGNVGAVVRVAAACGVGALIATTGCADPTSPRAVRASAGTIAMMDLVVGVDSAVAVVALQRAGVRVIATAMDGSIGLGDLGSGQPTAIVLGSEGAGVSPAALELADDTVSLPMVAPVESLNVAVTAGVVLYGLVGVSGTPISGTPTG